MLPKKRSMLFLALFLSAWMYGQDTLGPVEFLDLVRENHPVSLQARLIREKAKAARLKASGNFDPKLFNETSQKYFDSKTYYRLQNSGLSIPAWFGLALKTGYEQNDGIYLNGQNTVPAAGLWYADVSLTLGKGLFIDERRAALQQARLLGESAEYEIELALNELFQKAMNAYWEWYRWYQVRDIYEEAVDLATERFEAVRENAFIGEEPFIDTLEAYILYQNRLLSLQSAQSKYIHASRKLETFLWLDGLVTLELREETVPVKEIPVPQLALDPEWATQHPLLKFYDLKAEQLEVQQRLNKERLKPQLDIHYKFLNEAVAADDFWSAYSPGNYQWGLTASFPIFLRKERSEIRKTDIEIRSTNYEQELKRRSLINDISALRFEFDILAERLIETEKMMNNYETLLKAEITKFDNGESSLFLINQREIKYLESVEKYRELQARFQQLSAEIRSMAAVLD